MSALINFVKSRLDLLELKALMKASAADCGDLQKKCTEAMVKCIQGVTTVSVENSIVLTKLVAETAHLDAAQKDAFLRELDNRLETDVWIGSVAPDGSAVNNSHMAKLQTFTSFRNFLWEELWAIIMNIDMPYIETMKACARFSKKIGLNHPNEKTVQRVVTTVVCARIEITKSDVSSNDRLVCVRAFKDFLRSMPFQVEGPSVYPDTPKDLQNQYPNVYLSLMQLLSQARLRSQRKRFFSSFNGHLAARTGRRFPRHLVGRTSLVAILGMS